MQFIVETSVYIDFGLNVTNWLNFRWMIRYLLKSLAEVPGEVSEDHRF